MLSISEINGTGEPIYCLSKAEIEELARQAGIAAATETVRLMAPAREEAELYSPMRAAKLLGVTHNTVRNWIRAGIIEASKVGCHYLIPGAEIARITNAATRYGLRPGLETAKVQPSADISAPEAEKISPKV